MTISPKPMPSYSEAFHAAEAALAGERWHQKLMQDVAQWAAHWGLPVNAALLLRLTLLEPGFQVVFSVRLQEGLSLVPGVGRLLRRILWYCTCIWHGCDISPAAKLGGGLMLPHPSGVVIGGDCVLGKRVRIHQHVTLGLQGQGLGRGSFDRRSPCIGDDVTVFSGACVIGPVTLGAGCVVGANAVVLKDVPAEYSAVGVPARNLPPRSPSDVTAEHVEQ